MLYDVWICLATLLYYAIKIYMIFVGFVYIVVSVYNVKDIFDLNSDAKLVTTLTFSLGVIMICIGIFVF